MAHLKKARLNDMYVKGGSVREDGRMLKEQHLYQVKTLEESKYAWDYDKLVKTVPGEQAFTPTRPKRPARAGSSRRHSPSSPVRTGFMDAATGQAL